MTRISGHLCYFDAFVEENCFESEKLKNCLNCTSAELWCKFDF